MIRQIVNKKQIIIWGVSLLPVVLVLALYGKMPDQIPTNWGMNGQVTYGEKENIWAIAGMAPLVGVLLAFLPWIDPKKRNWQKFWNVYQSFQLFMQIFLLAVTGIILVETFWPGTIDVTAVICVMCGMLFMMIGNMMPKFRQNYFCGFRTPWTLSNEIVWMKTHRLGGRLYVVAGLIGVCGALIPDDRWKMACLFIPLIVASLVPYGMGYVWYQRLTKDVESEKNQ